MPNLANREANYDSNSMPILFMSNDLSIHHINNNLKASIAFVNHLGEEVSFHGITNKQHILSFLDSKPKSADDDPEMK